jgi:hypothetical protein
MTVPVAMLRKAAQRRAEETSIAATAAEVGLSHSVLRKFILGTAPYTLTLKRLRAWYERTEAGPTMTPEHARAVVASLVRSMPPEHREDAASGVVALLVERYHAAGVKVPEWLEEISKG